jgi:hypothetical protein
MKLFQQLLVAGASMSLIAPIAAQASDVVNLEEMTGYLKSSKTSSKLDSKTFINEVSEDIAVLEGSIDGLETSQNILEAGSFSDTTVADQKVVFSIGAAEHDPQSSANTTHPAAADNRNEGVSAQYSYTMNLNSSFTGDDNLYIRLKTGNGAGWMAEKDEGGYLSSTNTGANEIHVDKIWYTFPIGERHTVWVGPRIENYYMHATTPSLYSPTLKQFTLGGNGAAYGASTNSGLGWAYKFDNGFAVSSNVVSKQNTTTNGFLTAESQHSWATQVGYTQDQYSVSAILNNKYNGWIDEYFSTQTGQSRDSVGVGTNSDSTNIGLRAWVRPEESGSVIPSISVGYDTSSIQFGADNADSTNMWFAGFGWADIFQAEDKIGLAIGQPQQREDETTDPFAWEAYYAFKTNDYTEYRTTIFGGSDRNGTANDDISGLVFQTTFKF